MMDDLDRNVWCLLGLPFDTVGMNQTVDRVHNAATNKTPCFISTPNLNFMIASQKDKSFRDSVINSDLSIADGRPLIWISKLLGIPITERVAGSDLVEELIKNKKGYKPLKVFFFGGQEGVAELACKNLNNKNTGLECVGFFSPGFCAVEDMSTDNIINKINQSGADFIIVALGAKKGQAWIEYNRDKLTAPIISHLGAVINFIAGNVKRSPKLLQKLGLEWLWRIKEEPSLWRRYFFDGLSLMVLMVKFVIPYSILNTWGRYKINNFDNLSISSHLSDNSVIIKINGIVGEANLEKIRNHFRKGNHPVEDVYMNLDEIEYIDSAFIGYLLLLRKKLNTHSKELYVSTTSPYIRRIFYLNRCDNMLSSR